jgi:UDP-N-acetylglucosamine--N-acetylmuramyl-(pentapeptide) pyrophosphoryl-undecaprenol N-acetylglucosamine transferase
VVGGSLGARSINIAVSQGVRRWVTKGYQIIWQTGQLFGQQATEAVKGLSGVFVSDFVWDMNAAYSASDLVISRAGAMSVTELCLTGKPVIFVPFPYAAEDHQTANAMALVEKDAAWIVKDSDVSDHLMERAFVLAADKELREKMHRNIKPLAKDDADIVIANEILNDLKNS